MEGIRGVRGGTSTLRSLSGGGLELLGIELLEEHARRLAALLSLARRHGGGRPHLRRLNDDARVLREVYTALADDARRESVSPAAEWLLDNFHMISAATLDIRHDLPASFFRRLPIIATDEFAGLPRVYALALELIRCSAGSLHAQRLHRFITAFQSVTPLTIGELWAWPSALKLALVEHLRVRAGVLADSRAQQEQADLLVRALETRPLSPGGFPPELRPAFVVRLLERSREYGATAATLRRELDAALAARGETVEDAIRAEGRHQAAEQVTMANLVDSLRLIASFDWSEFFESVSLVEQVLQRDPAAVYGRMDFPSRDRYRHAVEQVADPTGDSQLRVALKAVERARQVAAQTPDSRGSHVGYHLIGNGRRGFEESVASVPTFGERIRRFVFAYATPGYLGTSALGTAMLVAVAILYAHAHGWRGVALAVVALLTVVPASELTIQVLQRIITHLIPPRRLPRLELDKVPASARTMVIVPTMLDSAGDVVSLLAHLEVQAIGNVDPHIHFAVLSDFRDASTETVPQDAEILEAARAGIAALNEKHGDARGDRFFLFHRLRQWNQAEGRWMGWERKRGKIEEFNRLLRGATDTSFAVQVGDLSILPDVRYCITLDTDTRLPRDAARQLIGIIMHPLNRARFDAGLGRVVEGYGILQPRISVTFMSAAGSLFAQLYAGHTGVDPYTTAVSDTYQDLFNEGIFTGKGLYDVDAFIASLEDSIPENTLLSHDLFEGLHARVALVSDVELVDEYPSSVLTHARRQHRWIRGDWQILYLAVPVRAVATGAEAEHAAAHLPLEDPGQPSPQPRGTDAARPGGGRVDHPPRLALVLDGRGDRRACVAAAAGRGAAPDRALEVAVRPGLSPQSLARHHHVAGADPPQRDVPGVSRVRHRARHRTDGRASCHATAAAGVGNGRDGRGHDRRAQRTEGAAAVRLGDAVEPHHGRHRRRRDRGNQQPGTAAGGAVPAAVAGCPCRRILAQRAGRPARPAAERCRADAAPADRTQHLAVLRGVHHRGRWLASTRQLSGD